MMIIDVALLLLRVALGATFLAHGIPKVRGKKGGFMTFIGVCETLGALAVISGFLTQLAGAGLAVIMLGAIYMHAIKWKTGFTGENGWELPFLLLTISLSLFLLGAGAYATDALLALPALF